MHACFFQERGRGEKRVFSGLLQKEKMTENTRPSFIDNNNNDWNGIKLLQAASAVHASALLEEPANSEGDADRGDTFRPLPFPPKRPFPFLFTRLPRR